MPRDSSQTRRPYLLLVLRRRIGRNLPAGDKNVVPVQPAIHDTDWQIVLQLESAHFDTFIANSAKLEKPANDRDYFGLLYPHGSDDEMLSTQISNLDRA